MDSKRIDIDMLRRAFQKPLPGLEGQKQMLPKTRNLVRPDEKSCDFQLSAVMIVLFMNEGELHTIFTIRSEQLSQHKGQISFPGGKYDDEDRTLEHTALRETNEELRMDTSNIKIIGQLTDLFIPHSNFRVSPFIGFMEEIPTISPNEAEVQGVIYATVESLLDPSNINKGTFGTRDGIEITAPYFNIQGKRIWGATAMITAELVVILKELYNQK